MAETFLAEKHDLSSLPPKEQTAYLGRHTIRTPKTQKVIPPQSKKRPGETTNEYVVRLEIQAGRMDDLKRRTKNHDPRHEQERTAALWNLTRTKGAKLIIGG